MPLEGESERVLITDVLQRRAWFPDGGVYILRDGDRVMYVGSTMRPLRLRLSLAISEGKTWTTADHTTWTVAMQRTRDAQARERELIAELEPVFNVRGRPRKQRLTPEHCVCRRACVCPDCGRTRLPHTAQVSQATTTA